MAVKAQVSVTAARADRAILIKQRLKLAIKLTIVGGLLYAFGWKPLNAWMVDDYCFGQGTAHEVTIKHRWGAIAHDRVCAWARDGEVAGVYLRYPGLCVLSDFYIRFNGANLICPLRVKTR